MKRILIYADAIGNGTRVGVNEAYVNFASQFGEAILVLPTNDLNRYINDADVLFIPGGSDIDPTTYGERPSKTTGRTNPHYEFLDKYLLKPWINTGKPIIAICRGMQALNVVLGGSLHQNIYGHVGGENRSRCDDVLCTNIPGYYYHETNSYHHQAVKKLGSNLEIIGWSYAFKNCPTTYSKDNIVRDFKVPKSNKEKDVLVDEKNYHAVVEIIKHKTLPYIGFQYHPEEFNCPLAIKLIDDVAGVPLIEDNSLLIAQQDFVFDL